MANKPGVFKDEKISGAIKKIIASYPEEERQDRFYRLRAGMDLRSRPRGNPYSWFDPVRMVWRSPQEHIDWSGWESNAESPNLIQATWQILQAALATTGIPSAIFEPQNPRSPSDSEVARIAQPIVEYEESEIDFYRLWLRNFRYQFTDGLALFHTRHVRNKDYFGLREVETRSMYSKTLRKAGYDCPTCGEFMEEERMGDDGLCPECRFPVDRNRMERQEPIKANIPIKEITFEPRGKEVVDCYGVVETRFPHWAPTLQRSPYAAIEVIVDKASVLAAFGEEEEALSADSNSESEDLDGDFARRMTVSPSGISIRSGLVTYRRWWLRPEAFYREQDKGLRKELLDEYPNGCLAQMADSVFLDCRPESMDEHLQLVRAYDSDGMYPPAYGDNAVPIQKAVDKAFPAEIDAAEFAAFPPVLADKGVLSKAIKNIVVRAAQIIFLELPPGKTLKDSYHQMQIKESSQANQKIMDKAFRWLEVLVGSAESLLGSSVPGVRANSQYQAVKNQALQRLGPPYETAKKGFAEIKRQLVVEFLSKRSDDEIKEVVGPMLMEKIALMEGVDLSKGKLVAKVEDTEAVPATWGHRVAAMQALLASQNPFVQRWLEDPNNAEAAQRLLGVRGLIAPGKMALEKIRRMVPLMLAGQQFVVNQNLDNAQTILRYLQEWSASPEGIEAQGENPNFRMVEEYAAQAQAILQQAAVAAQQLETQQNQAVQ